ncbi:MAG: TIGR03621 family F420-dependent LLM class oxidoreductase, partial [Dehalococcoidia bacterium]
LTKELATLDVLSDGRLEIGLGAGWMRSDYDQSGLPFDRPGVRIDKLAESLAIVKGLMADEPLTFEGIHYQIFGHNGTPKPVQKPHPPLLVGGGGKRVLTLAAREADIVGVNFVLAEGVVNPAVAVTGSADATAEKVGWVRAAASGRDIEMNVTVFVTAVTDDQQSMAERVAPGFGLTPEDVLGSPHVLIGEVEQIVEALQQRREAYGFSYVVFSGDVFDAAAPVVKKLAGT